MYNHIPGHGVLTRKDLGIVSIKNYALKMRKKPDCFNPDTFFPKSFNLDDKEDCKAFFKEINSENFNKNRIKEPI